jgi:hypothetical protein
MRASSPRIRQVRNDIIRSSDYHGDHLVLSTGQLIHGNSAFREGTRFGIISFFGTPVRGIRAPAIHGGTHWYGQGITKLWITSSTVIPGRSEKQVTDNLKVKASKAVDDVRVAAHAALDDATVAAHNTMKTAEADAQKASDDVKMGVHKVIADAKIAAHQAGSKIRKL